MHKSLTKVQRLTVTQLQVSYKSQLCVNVYKLMCATMQLTRPVMNDNNGLKLSNGKLKICGAHDKL